MPRYHFQATEDAATSDGDWLELPDLATARRMGVCFAS